MLREQPVAPPVAGDEIPRWQVRKAGIGAHPDLPAADGTNGGDHLAIRVDGILGVGIAMQDIAIGALLLARARAAGVGLEIDLAG